METAIEQAKIRVDNLTKVFRGTKRGSDPVVALDDISFEVPDGQFLCVVGPSGCGKTTLLRIMAGLETETSGSLAIRCDDPERPLNSMVFQESSVLPWMTVRKNIGYGLRMRGLPRSQQKDIVEQFLKKVGLSKFRDTYPHQLSGGMKQRVSVARAFANDPEILLMDEPFAALDEQNKILLQRELLRIWEGPGTDTKTVVYVTHSLDEALFLADRVILMTALPGKVKLDVEVDLPRPRKITELRTSPRFTRLFREIWEALREEVVKDKQSRGLDFVAES